MQQCATMCYLYSSASFWSTKFVNFFEQKTHLIQFIQFAFARICQATFAATFCVLGLCMQRTATLHLQLPVRSPAIWRLQIGFLAGHLPRGLEIEGWRNVENFRVRSFRPRMATKVYKKHQNAQQRNKLEVETR